MKKKIAVGILVLILGISSVVGCGQKALINPKNQKSESAAQIASGLNEFSLEMGQMLYQEYEGQNFVCSPISFWFPLAALTNATEGTVREELLTSLEAEGLTAEEVNEAASRILYSLTKTDWNPALKIANGVFVSDKYAVSPEFAQIYEDYYRGSCQSIDFTASDAEEKMNKWISKKTGGMIEDVVVQLSPDTDMAILNTIYFQDEWVMKFNKIEPIVDDFYGENETTRAEYMIHRERTMVHYEDERLQAVCLEYRKGAKLYVLLPYEETAGELYCSLTMEYMNKIIEEASEKTGRLYLPKFSIEGESMELDNLLEKMEVPLSQGGITKLLEGEENLYINKALQKVIFQVDEEKTSAAAVSLKEFAVLGGPSVDFYMECNKPFVFFLTDTTYDGGTQILFSGVVNQL